MSFGFKTFKANGDLEWSFTGLSPRIHSSGLIFAPGQFAYNYTISIPEITDPSEWYIIDIPYFNVSLQDYAYIKAVSISVGQISITIYGPTYGSGYLKYIVFKVK